MKIIVYKTNRKSLSLSVNDDLDVIVRAPKSLPNRKINEFVNKNREWIDSAIERKKTELAKFALSDEEIQELIKEAQAYVPLRVEYFSSIMNLKPTSVKITKAKKRFGSCSSKNSLCFSCFLMNYPAEAIDYVVVHELAHIKHHNHSKEFYELINTFMPDYKKRIKLLKS